MARRLRFVFDRFRSRRQKKGLVETGRRHLGELLDQLDALLMGEDIRRELSPGDESFNALDDLRMGMAGIRHENARGPVDPAVAEAIVDARPLGVVPEHGRLAVHRHGLMSEQLLKVRHRFGHRKRGDNASIFRFDARHLNWFKAESAVQCA